MVLASVVEDVAAHLASFVAQVICQLFVLRCTSSTRYSFSFISPSLLLVRLLSAPQRLGWPMYPLINVYPRLPSATADASTGPLVSARDR